jgi:hypothetical protein
MPIVGEAGFELEPLPRKADVHLLRIGPDIGRLAEGIVDRIPDAGEALANIARPRLMGLVADAARGVAEVIGRDAARVGPLCDEAAGVTHIGRGSAIGRDLLDCLAEMRPTAAIQFCLNSRQSCKPIAFTAELG